MYSLKPKGVLAPFFPLMLYASGGMVLASIFFYSLPLFFVGSLGLCCMIAFVVGVRLNNDRQTKGTINPTYLIIFITIMSFNLALLATVVDIVV